MTKASERRDGPRIDLRLRVRYRVDGSQAEAEASDVSPKGLRLESESPVAVGTELNLHVDAGEAEELQATGHVTWCRPHTSPTGKQVYDVGVRFEGDWLARDRGPLGTALARIFAMNSYEPARSFERTPVSLQAKSAAPTLDLEVIDISVGGMRLRSKGAPVGDHVRSGVSVHVDIEADGVHKLMGRVAWVAGQGASGEGPRVSDSFGVEFATLSSDDKALLERIRTGQVSPSRISLLLAS
jgi:Tfp pilus assembly protein PilZ